MELIISIVYIVTLVILGVFSYGFVDPNLTLSTSSLYARFDKPLFQLVYYHRPITTGLFLLILFVLFVCYSGFMKVASKKVAVLLFLTSLILIFSYPAVTYDLFNYITTAKVTFTHHENPYVVMPIEITNEPYLAFTRAANKYALYGPIWILLTAIPHYLGNGNIWLTIFMFKCLNAVGYLLF